MRPLSQTSVVGFTLGVFGLAKAYLDSRYYTSPAFERPVHFSIATLLLAGLAICAYVRFSPGRQSSPSYSRVADGQHQPTRLLPRLARLLRSCVPSASFALLLFCLVARTLLQWRVIRTVHCSWDGFEALLPVSLALCDSLNFRPIYLPRHALDDAPARKPSYAYALMAAVWGFAAAETLLLSEHTTSVICPPIWGWERLIPLAQLVALALDSLLMAQVGRLRQQGGEDQFAVWRLLGTLLLSSAGVLAFLAVWSSIDQVNLRWNFQLSWLAIGGLVADSLAAAVAVVSAIFVLRTVHFTVLGLLAAAVSIFVSVEGRVSDGTMIDVWSTWWGFIIGVVVFAGFGILLHLSRLHSAPKSPSREGLIAMNRYTLGGFVVFLVVFLQAGFGRPVGVSRTPGPLIAAAKADSQAWIAAAATSTTLQSAVENYRQRYRMPPPPNFDKWFEYATTVNSSIIDIFDQIDVDLLPYWGTPASVIRQRTTHLLEHPNLSMGGLIIEKGQVTVSPHVPGSHRWMLDVTQSMMEPFAQWLPDMQLAFNLDDECRISVPQDRMKAYTEEALAAKARLGSKQQLSNFSTSLTPPWEQDFLDAGEEIWQSGSPYFFSRSFSPIFYEWIAPTCSPDAPASNYHWWNRKAECGSCSSPHMKDGFVSNWTLAGDLCHQPDLAYMHGFLASPSAMGPSDTLFPVFSQSRVNGFADILYPSPWSFNEKALYDPSKDFPWAEKLNSVFWRGASSDGFATHGAWQMFMRARFVFLAARDRVGRGVGSLLRLIPSHSFKALSSSSSEESDPGPGGKPPAGDGEVVVNVTFVGHFDSRCDESDCAAEHATFYGSGPAGAEEPPPPVDFQESWRHRHLVDLDGAAFSGRFLPFVASGSLPYRAALFRTWWEERIHPWRHYVPLDARLADLWPAVDYLAGGGGGGGMGPAQAEEMASAGQEWAPRALRKEDMQVYMFRLLLEWGRVIDDRREDVGFEMGGGGGGDPDSALNE
ncbi:glycosyltransferase family 90 protein [Xylariaceae sp. FL0804]|nr:glycosyltransferase family 90 protein [Xylariaceae sp. FL0804]